MLRSRLRHPHLLGPCLLARYERVSGAVNGPQPSICSASWRRRQTYRVSPGGYASTLVAVHLAGGAWLHPDAKCAELAERRRAFARALRVPAVSDVATVVALISGKPG